MPDQPEDPRPQDERDSAVARQQIRRVRPDPQRREPEAADVVEGLRTLYG